MPEEIFPMRHAGDIHKTPARFFRLPDDSIRANANETPSFSSFLAFNESSISRNISRVKDSGQREIWRVSVMLLSPGQLAPRPAPRLAPQMNPRERTMFFATQRRNLKPRNKACKIADRDGFYRAALTEYLEKFETNVHQGEMQYAFF
jgi:hypothetical protein